jgi:predicted metallopeptidase
MLYRLADEVRTIGEDLIATVKDHFPLQLVNVTYLFTDKAPEHQGRVVWGRARKVSGLAAFLAGPKEHDEFVAGSPFFVIEISHPIWQKLSDAMRRALVDHELCHCEVEQDSNGIPKLSMRGHDFEEFVEIIRRHGLWSSTESKVARAMAEQLADEIDSIVAYSNQLADTTPSTDTPPTGAATDAGDSDGGE